MLEQLKGYRTIVFNLIMTIVMVLAMWSPGESWPTQPEVNAFLDSLEIVLTFVWGLGNIVLRAITNTPIFMR